MRKTAVVALVVVLAGVGPPAGASPVPGTITRDTTWTKAESPVRIGSVFVISGVTLTIEPGVEVIADPGGLILVEGGLRAQGTDAEPIVFRPATDERWGGIRFLDAAGRPASAIEGVRITGAQTGVSMGRDAFPIHDSVFESNGTALEVLNPSTNVTFTNNLLYSNELAFTGKTTGVVGLYENDFWDNGVSLLLRGQGPYSCNDPGIFAVHYNDILRGPDSPWASFDVRTSPESGETGMVVNASSNWWGTTDEGDIQARISPNGECCPGRGRAPVLWQEPATSPQTAAQPPGPVGMPPEEPEVHGDPEYIVDVHRPDWGECLPGVDRLAARVYPALGDAPGQLPISIARGTRRCKSFDPLARGFVKAPCDDPVGFEVPVRDRRGAMSDRVFLRFMRPLRPGRYTFVVGDHYSDVSQFRVLP